jgi:hypothetical protein
MYDTSGKGKAYKKLTFNSLAWWHSYKAAFQKMYHIFAKEFIAPLFHTLFPAGIFFPKPKYLANIIQIFTYIRMAYKSFKPQLDKALNDKRLKPHNRCHLLNLRTLCEFLIPAVHFYTTHTIVVRYCIFCYHLFRRLIVVLCNMTKWY